MEKIKSLLGYFCYIREKCYLCTQYDLPRFPKNSAPGEVFEFLCSTQNDH